LKECVVKEPRVNEYNMVFEKAESDINDNDDD
jgi:hypothetical protein